MDLTILPQQILPNLHATCLLDMRNDLKQKEGLTISLDGWTDAGRNSVYAVLVLQGDEIKHYVDWLHLHEQRHTSKNILVALNEYFEGLELRWDNINAVVIDSSSTMVKFWHEIGFLRCVEKAKDQSVVTPTISLPICQLVRTQDHFTANKALIEFLKPVVDALARLEREITLIAHIWKEICTVYCALKTIDILIWPQYFNFKNDCFEILNKRAQMYQSNIYIVGFFLAPNVQRMMVKITFVWAYSKADAINLKDQARMYLEGIEPFNLSKKFLLALNYWRTLPATLTTNQIHLFTIKLLELVPHAGGVESLFTHMAATKNKSRN
ncbi:hypothetical protein DFH28DRAFT_927625 [Melampsora americana]|nr:hypothetical protein DFH28DRAFT_927625 [Melampsora americana]